MNAKGVPSKTITAVAVVAVISDKKMALWTFESKIATKNS
jgi:hypothetical protein